LGLDDLKLHLLRPRQRDLQFALGDLEALALRQLWDAARPLSVREFQAMISRTRPVAVTTVATILDRLHRKGVVSRQLVKDGGPHYLYSAKLTEAEFKHIVVDNVMGTLLQSFNDVTVAYLTEKMAGSKPGDRRTVSKYLKRLRSEASA
jgi:predicted transcriptional regulator